MKPDCGIINVVYKNVYLEWFQILYNIHINLDTRECSGFITGQLD